MQEIKKIYISLLLKLGIALAIFTLFRVLFIVFNNAYFSDIDAVLFWGGLRFDWMTISLLYSPFIIGHLIDYKGKSKILAALFHVSNTIAILLQTLDLEYYKFTFKRTTTDLFKTQGLVNDLSNLVFTFIWDFWYLFVIAGFLIWISVKAYKKTCQVEISKPRWFAYLFFLIPVLAGFSIGVRGGLQLKPLSVISAGQYANAQNIPIVLNTPFTIIKSATKKGEVETPYFSESEKEKIFNPVLIFHSDSIPNKLNVVIIIAESFSKEYIGAFNPPGYTPYLDTLIAQSLVFENAFANGKKSVEALPAILSGIPSLMTTPYISSKYGSNQIESVGSVLAANGYNTSFYHGGENGTMGFSSFTQIAGIETYNGRDQYPYKNGYDGVWGIFDEPYLSYVLEDINKKDKPFFTGIFTLSSHHPYTVPAEYTDQFEAGPIPILKSVRYADFALHQFMEAAKKEPWFDETLFIITADHTSQGMHMEYKSRIGMYRVPLIFYAPKYITPKRDLRIAQHVDIFPSIIDYLEIEAQLVTYGKSVFSDDSVRYNVNFIRGVYQIIGPKYCLIFDGESATGLYEIATDPTLKINLIGTGIPEESILLNHIKAVLQDYRERMIRNELYVKTEP